jgi:hypothetical protein
MLDYKLTLPKYCINKIKFVGLEVHAIGKEALRVVTRTALFIMISTKAFILINQIYIFQSEANIGQNLRSKDHMLHNSNPTL